MKFKTILKIIAYIFLDIILIFSIALTRLTLWYLQTFTIGIQEIFFTIKSPLQGADTNFLKNAIAFINIKYLVLIFVLFLFLIFIFEFVFLKINAAIEINTNKKQVLSIKLYPLTVFLLVLAVFYLLFCAIRFADKSAGITEYIKQEKTQTTIFEDKYVKPSEEIIHGQGKNLIYIYLESMETTYASKDIGGYQSDNNYIPYLTELGEQNILFSDKSDIGGFHVSTGAGWTMGALFTMSSGIPFKFPVEGNDMNLRTTFASGVTVLGDILKDKGYTQEFLCGSNAGFAGRRQFYEQHGNYKIFDYFSALEYGYIEPDYFVWWGFEDEILYKIAKDEILNLAQQNAPFNFTMLTVDTHHIGGYKCNLCEDKYPENLANVLACADKQLYEFVQWCKEQNFYDNTVIVIVGDHPRMDSILVDGVSYYDRTVYNCFINSSKPVQLSTKHREFCSLDMFPTVLSSMGFEIEGDRLGLGTDLFSSTLTFSEEMGFDCFNEELSKYSRYYIDTFS